MLSFDLWVPVWFIGGMVLASNGLISWWTFGFVVASHFSLTVKT